MDIAEKNDEVMWLVDSEPDKPYQTTTWYRCVKGEEFVNKVKEKYKIVGITFEGNNIGFILDKK
jgi:hypothetical protein